MGNGAAKAKKAAEAKAKEAEAKVKEQEAKAKEAEAKVKSAAEEAEAKAKKAAEEAEAKAKSAVSNLASMACGAGEMTPGQALALVKTSQTQLQEWQQKLNVIMDVPLPKIEVHLPRLTPQMLGAAMPAPEAMAAPETERLLSIEAPELPAVPSGTVVATDCAEYMQSLRVIAVSATISIAVAAGVHCAGLTPFLEHMISAVAAVVINFVGLIAAWKMRVDGIYSDIQMAFAKLTQGADKVLAVIKPLVEGPVKQLTDTIDAMLVEQKPTLDQVNKHEKELKAQKPDLNIPSVDTLKQPLTVVPNMIDTFFKEASTFFTTKVTELIKSNKFGKIVMDKSEWDKYTLYAPLFLCFLLNVVVAVLTVVTTGVLLPEPSADVTSRQLRGHSMRAQLLPPHPFINTTVAAAAGGAMNATAAASGPAALFTGPKVMSFIMPVLVQIVMAVVLVLVGMFMSRKEKLCEYANDAIGIIEVDMNAEMNRKAKDFFEKVFGQAVGGVKTKSNEFFPKILEILAILVERLEKLAMLTGGA